MRPLLVSIGRLDDYRHVEFLEPVTLASAVVSVVGAFLLLAGISRTAQVRHSRGVAFAVGPVGVYLGAERGGGRPVFVPWSDVRAFVLCAGHRADIRRFWVRVPGEYSARPWLARPTRALVICPDAQPLLLINAIPRLESLRGRPHGRSRRLGELGGLGSRGTVADVHEAHARVFGRIAAVEDRATASDRVRSFVERLRRGARAAAHLS